MQGEKRKGAVTYSGSGGEKKKKDDIKIAFAKKICT